MKVETDDMQWWRDKVDRIGQKCFNATCATWATHLLDKFVLTDVRIKASFPNPDDEEKIREMFKDDLELDRMGIDVHLQGNEVHFAVPIFVVVGEKLV
jgi:hypothetical protein